MEKKAKISSKKFSAFLKKNVYYILMVLCVIAIGTMIIVAAVQGKDSGIGDKNVIKPPVGGESGGEVVLPDPTTPQPVQKFSIIMPVSNATVGLGFSEDKLVATGSGNFRTHRGVDYHTAAGSSVKAVASGTITSIAANGLEGNVIVIKHKEGFESVYKMMGEKVNVKIGQVVNSGDVLGTVELVATSTEKKLGTHLHFELKKDGMLVNPNDYKSSLDK